MSPATITGHSTVSETLSDGFFIMPQSSIYLRLQWPSSSSSESSHETSSVLSSSSSVENQRLCKPDSPQSPSVTGLMLESETMKDPSSEKLEERTTRPFVPLSRCLSSPVVKCKDGGSFSSGDTYECRKDISKLKKKSKVKMRVRPEGSKARRIERSLSASSTSVSTNTDPEDFIYACLVSKSPSTLPRNFKEISPRVIVPKVDPILTTENEKEKKLSLDCKSLDIPYIDREQNGKDEFECSAAPINLYHQEEILELLSENKERVSLSRINPLPSKLISRKDVMYPVNERKCHKFQALADTIEEECIPDILNECKLHPDFSSSPDSSGGHVEHIFQSSGCCKTEGDIYDASNKACKKSVKFLLPPEYFESFISEENESCGEYPPSGYAELDGSLMPPNGQDPYRNTPSPGLHGVPNDRYDGVYEEEGYLGEFPNDGGLRGGRPGDSETYRRGREDNFRGGRQDEYRRGREEFPPAGTEGAEGGGYMSTRDMDPYLIGDGDVYGQLRPPPRPPSASQTPFAMNGGLSGSHSSGHLIHSYDDDQTMQQQRAPSVTIPIAQPSPQISMSNTPLLPSHVSPGPATPTLSPPGHPNHDTYAPPSLLRSPSADSTSRVRWRDPDLHEVIDFLSNPNNVVKANAAAYLQHLCYMDDATKQKTRILGGIPPLVALLSHDLPELHRNACGALRNLSYGRQNDENKRAIKEAGGLPTLVRLLRKTLDNEVKELVTGILWNLSSCEDLKQSILDDALAVLVNHVIIPCSGWDGGEVERDPNNDVWWSTVFKNASGIIRNISSAGEYARTKLRHCPGLVDSLFCVIKLAIQGNSHDNKSVENCVCILRNLSYRCQEVEDPNYDKNQPPTQSRATATGKDGEEDDGSDKCGDNLGCFGGSRKKKDMVGGQLKESSSGPRSTGPRGQPVRGMELLWQPELVVQPYLALLSDCSNPETLEAAAGAIQNLAACYWQPSIDVRAAVRKDKGLPILVELLRMEVDRVVCAVATALRNLAIDQRNKELIGKYAMRDLVQKLPSQNSHDTVTSDETIAAVLATLNEVIKKNAEFSRSLLDAGGVDRLVYITKQRGRYSTRVVKFASQVLFSMWGHQELREVYKKAGWKEQDFVSKSVAARNAAGANSPTANNTLNRPMASQGGTRYEDRTIQRSNNQPKHHQQYQRREEVPLADLGYGGDVGEPGGGVRHYSSMQGKPGEPVYAKVNRDKKRNRQFDTGGIYGSTSDEWGEAPPAYSAIHPNPLSSNYSEPNLITSTSMADAANNNEILHIGASEPAGDSWV